jgi:hypothetical protein
MEARDREASSTFIKSGTDSPHELLLIDFCLVQGFIVQQYCPPLFKRHTNLIPSLSFSPLMSKRRLVSEVLFKELTEDMIGFKDSLFNLIWFLLLETAARSSKSFRPSSKNLPPTLGRALVTGNVQKAAMMKHAASSMKSYVHTLHHCNLATHSLYSSTLRLLGYWSTCYTFGLLHLTFTVSLNLFASLSFTSYENSLSSPQNLTWTSGTPGSPVSLI